jgi:signal-transduction protein with cAMP-binding, CBS, and nucleotidyltransferase domain
MKTYYRGDILNKNDEVAQKLYIIAKGSAEVSIMLEGNRFVVEKLYSEAIINSKIFFIEDYTCTEITVSEESLIYELDHQSLNTLMSD